MMSKRASAAQPSAGGGFTSLGVPSKLQPNMGAPEPWKEGSDVVVEGIARGLDAPLQAPLSDRPCIYWEVREGLDGAPVERADAGRFWLESERGRLLVDLRHAELDVLAERRKQTIALADSDVHAVSARLRALKQARKQAAGPALRELNGETKQLKKLATLLCAIRAHARDNVHVGGTLKGQQRYITERSAQLRGQGVSARSLGLTVERFESLICAGQQVRVSGRCERGPAPTGSGQGGSYRQAPQCLHLRPTANGPVIIRGLGASAPAPRPKQRNAPSKRHTMRNGRANGWKPYRTPIVIVALFLLATLVVRLFW